MSLHADITVRLDGFRLRAAVRAEPGATVVLAGPNGAGKTTFVRALAGVRPIDGGRIALDGIVLDDGDAWVPANRRRVGLVSQAGHLFAHLSVLDNVAFGPRCRGANRRTARADAAAWLDLLGVGALAQRPASALSGGQARLVAVARALAVRPRLLLLDEPFAGLDATVRPRVRRELRRLLTEHDGVRVIVAHDPVDALTLGDTIVVLQDGEVVQTGTPDDLRARPACAYVADLVGVNLLHGRLEGNRIALAGGVDLVVATTLADGPVLAVVHPRAISLHHEQQSGSPRNTFRGTVVHVDDEGDRLRVQLHGPLPLVAEITPAAAIELGIEVGSSVHASVKATEIAVHQD